MADHIWKEDNGEIYCVHCFMRKHWPGAKDPCHLPHGLPQPVRKKKKKKDGK